MTKSQGYKIFLICFLIFGMFVLFANVLNLIYGFDTNININVEPHEKGEKGPKSATGEQDMQYPPDYVLRNGSGWIDGKTNKYIKWNFSD